MSKTGTGVAERAVMGFYLELHEPAGPGVQRLARQRIDAAVRALTDETIDAGEAVHCARKQIKKLRATLRLVREGLGERRYRRENTALRDLGRSLGAARDADVMLATFDRLVKKRGEGVGERGAAAIRRRLVAKQAGAQPRGKGAAGRRQLQRVARELGKLRGRIDRWSIEAIDHGVLTRGLERTYARGRKAMRSAYAEGRPDAERLHDWRKRVKDLWYHLRIVSGANPRNPRNPRRNRRRIAMLKELADRLGEDHDLAVLRAEVEGMPKRAAAGAAAAAVAEAAERRRRSLQRKASALGERAYRGRPGRFVGVVV